MKVLKIILVLILGCLPISAIAQQGYGTDTINQFDANGEKHGFWIETFGNYIWQLYYSHGKKDGIYWSINKTTGNLFGFCEYKNDELTGVFYAFGDNGHLLSEMRDFGKNDKAVLDRPTPPNKCYYVSYHPNGAKKSEGVLLWYEDPELDDAVEYGEWIYYDPNGKVLEKKIHK